MKASANMSRAGIAEGADNADGFLPMDAYVNPWSMKHHERTDHADCIPMDAYVDPWIMKAHEETGHADCIPMDAYVSPETMRRHHH